MRYHVSNAVGFSSKWIVSGPRLREDVFDFLFFYLSLQVLATSIKLNAKLGGENRFASWFTLFKGIDVGDTGKISYLELDHTVIYINIGFNSI